MSQHFVAHDGIGYHVWRLVNGRYRLNVGPHFATPREAMAFADSLDSSLATRPAQELPPAAARIGSPDDGSTPARSVTPAGTGSVAPDG